MSFVNDDNQDPHAKPWLLIALAVLPAVLPVVFERVGHEVSDYFKRRRLAKKKAELEAKKEAAKKKKKEEADAKELEDKKPKELSNGEHSD
jgi:hypothetical protein